jgi:lipoprotein-releasing system permease protein
VTDPSSAKPRVAFDALPPVVDGSSWGAAWWLALRHLRSGNERFLGVVSAISVLGTLVGVALLIAVLAVMTGFEVDLRQKILGANAHVVVMKYGPEGMVADPPLLERLAAFDGVETAMPFTYAEVILRSRRGSTGAILKGVDPAITARVPEVAGTLSMGLQGPIDDPGAVTAAWDALARPVPAMGADAEALPGIILGDELAEQLSVLPGDDVQVVDPIGDGVGMLGAPVPRFKMFRVLGMFHSGMYEYDTKWSYVPIAESQSFFSMGDRVVGVEVRVQDVDGAAATSREMQDALGYPYFARHWMELNEALFRALALEKVVMSLILGMIVVVAGLLIVSNLYTLVLSRRREIAILKAMGASDALVRRVFLLVGTVIGTLGVVGGVVLGLALCLGLDAYEYPLETDVYFVSSLPVIVQPRDVVVVAVCALAIAFASAVYPAHRAAGVDPVDGLRTE